MTRTTRSLPCFLPASTRYRSCSRIARSTRDGSIHFTQVGDNPDIHPYWDPEYFGDTILVNGKVWPNLRVDRHQYRFRIVNGSNARFYNLKLSNGMSFTQIGGDGSYLPAPVTLTEALIAPAERIDILIDFSRVPAGTKIILKNTANQPFPGGDPVDPATTGQVMRFEVRNTPSVHPRALPAKLITIPTLVETEGIGNPKLFTLNEQESDVGEPVAVLIDGQHFDADITEVPKVGTTEAWYFQNLTEDAHPDPHPPRRVPARGSAGHRRRALQGLLGEPQRHDAAARSPDRKGQRRDARVRPGDGHGPRLPHRAVGAAFPAGERVEGHVRGATGEGHPRA